MNFTGSSIRVLATILALSLILPTGPFVPTSTSSPSRTIHMTPSTISVSIFFTNSSLNLLPLDARGNPRVDATIGIIQSCTGSGKSRSCHNYYVVQKTSPAQLIAWLNVTNTSDTPLQSLRLNETLPADWAVSPAWTTRNRGAIHVYYSNTTLLSTNREITQPSTISVSNSGPQIVSIPIPSFNATALHHPLIAGQSILVSVELTLAGGGKSYFGYPKNYTDTAVIAAWTQTSYAGTESIKDASGFFTTYANNPGPLNAPKAQVSLLDSVLRILYGLSGAAIVIAIILVIVIGLSALKSRRKGTIQYPTSTPP